MVRLLKLRNFRSHKNVVFRFCKGMNGIVGISQSGKTNIIRALQLLAFLKPAGLRFLKDRKDVVAEVKVETWEGKRVSIRKGRSVAEYKLNGATFKKFGRVVPEEIKEALNLSTINIQQQFEVPFLALSRPSEVSKVINAKTGMDDFDVWIDKINEKVRTLRTEKSVAEKKHEENLIFLEKLEGLEDIEPTIFEAELIRKEQKKLERKYEKTSELYSVIYDIEKRLKAEREIQKIAPKVRRAEAIQKRISVLDEKACAIEDMLKAKEVLEFAKEDYLEISFDFIEQLREFKRCPTCRSPIRQSVVERLKREVSSVI
jgi:exonuclease SbcC